MTVSDVQLPLFSDSIAFIQRIHRVFVILRHDRYLVARSRFYGQPHRDGLCIEEVSGHDETPSILPFRPSITAGIALYTMRPRLSLLLETGPLKGPASPHAADMRHLHADLPDTRERRWVIAFDLNRSPPETEARFIVVRSSILARKVIRRRCDMRC